MLLFPIGNCLGAKPVANITAYAALLTMVSLVTSLFNCNIITNYIGIETIKQLRTCNNKLFIANGRSIQNALQALIEKGQAVLRRAAGNPDELKPWGWLPSTDYPVFIHTPKSPRLCGLFGIQIKPYGATKKNS